MILFTASKEIYARAVVKTFDESGDLFDLILCRDQCILVGGKIACLDLTPIGSFVKDLRLLETDDRSLESMLIVDNLVTSFANQLEYGLPIRAFINDKKDKELPFLAEKLWNIDRFNSTVDFIEKEFRLKKFYASLEY